ncbi:MAG: hypothetical protein CL961_05310 [Euryarchaeota archaeon]|jgi:hypothetical protein|nr:hypothetical protein [Euryarchaeota archaeon]|tara:strand:- start:987 stop:1529 length:543 start_codon:yes stop_codon:yes gene_type:complete
MTAIDLPPSDTFAIFVIVILAGIVLWDAFWLTKQKRDIPNLGDLPNGGFAWASEGPQEVIRQWGNLFSMAAMMSLPWALISLSNTSIIYGIIWDILLALHIIYLLIPKRYAVTSTHLFADGQRYEWKKLRLAKRQPKRRIMLLRKGWGIFGPLPVGGKYHDLEQAKTAIARFYQMGEESE